MNVNIELQREREKCTFNIQELTEFIDGGSKKTFERKEREKLLLSLKDLSEGTPEQYLSYKEKYEVAMKKGVEMLKLVRQKTQEGASDLSEYKHIITNILGSAMSTDGSPLALHYMMFIPVLLSQASEEQQTMWLRRAWECKIIGSFAQTELGHGTFIRGLETTATYDPQTQEFVLHSPTLTSYKWWGGSLGHTANYSIVVAQLYTKGECHGIHMFFVQVRDEDTHMPLPGIKVGEIGSKMGLNVVNNGFLGFDNVRIPRNRLLMKHAQVLEDGTYVKSPHSKLNYGAMVFVRVLIVFDSINYLSKAVTVATRYSAVRRQCQLKQGETEHQVLDYVTQQHKLFTAIAACYAFKIAASKLWETYNDVNKELGNGNMERLSELHAFACCLKAVCTADTSRYVEKCRLSCGGYGYMESSSLPQLYTMVTASCTFEGDNTVLLLQTARFLVKTWSQIDTCNLTPTVAYLKTATAGDFISKWENSMEGLIRGFQLIAVRRIESSAESMKRRILSGVSNEDAWNLTTVQLVAAAEVHCRFIMISTFYEEIIKVSSAMSPALREVLIQLVELYAVYWTLEYVQDLLMYTSISKEDVSNLQSWYEDLLTKIRPNAIGLVDSFDIMDEFLQSALGAYDGRVYERLMSEAMKSPLNAEPVNQSFHKYLKPFMQGKL